MWGKGVLLAGLVFFIFLLSEALPVLSLNIDNCTVLDTPSETYLLTQSIWNSTNSTCMYVQADNVTLDCQGNRIDGVDNANTYGVRIPNYDNVTIRNCEVSDWAYGIDISSSAGSRIYNNFITSNTDRGINVVSGSTYNNLTNNTVFFNEDYGVVFASSSSNNFSHGNVSKNTNHGIWFSTANNNRVEYAVVSFNAQDGINLDSSDNNVIYETNTTSNKARGIYAASSSGNRIEGGKVVSNSNTGIWFYQSASNNVTSVNSSLNTNNGVYLESSSNGNRIENCIFLDNGGNGIYSQSSSNNLIINIDASLNVRGIMISYGSGNNVSRSNIHSNDNEGMRLTYTTNNYIIDTLINASPGDEVYADDTSSSNNYFINTTFDKNNISVNGNTVIWVRWYLQVQVKDMSENPVQGADVNITDSYNSLKFSGLTNSTGHITRQVLNEYNQTSSGKNFFTNYTINVSKSGYVANQTHENLTESRFVVIHLQDMGLPIVEVKTYTRALAETSIFRPGRMVRIRATVTSSTGRDYLSNATVLIKDNLGATKVGNANMANISEITNGYLYEYNYTLPSDASGLWLINVTATDVGNGKGYDWTKIAVATLNVQVKLSLNSTWNSAMMYVPGLGERTYSQLASISPYTDLNPPHYYLSSYLNDVLVSLVFSSESPLMITAAAASDEYEMQTDQRFTNFMVFLVFSKGNWRQVNNRMDMIEKGEFLSKLSPSFSYGLGNRYPFRIEIKDDDIDINNTLSIGRGYSRVVIENKGMIGSKVNIGVERV